ncbi:hypothetical protein DYQ86_16300 [Acidobacteria bacterium AB60]|nr:hypothetical protein DYQ86_16300 [Acidobacteria bacterium AB60]
MSTLTLTVKAQLERSLLFEEIQERRVKIESLQSREPELRLTLMAALDALSKRASTGKDYLAFRPDIGINEDFLGAEVEAVNEAVVKRNEVLADIRDHERQIEDLQRTLDDCELWEVA